MSAILNQLLNLIFPPACLGCGRILASGVICGQCLESIKTNQTLFCGKCQARLPETKKICHQDFPYLLGAATNYNEKVIKNLIQGLKFKHIKGAAQPLGGLIVRYIENLNLPLEKFTLIPIPLSSRRLKERGFNQSELIAKAFAEHFRLNLETSCLMRTKDAKPQSETSDLKERQNNVKNCFSVTNVEFVVNKNIILIDDVVTSGATFFAAAETLKRAGAKRIIALAAAKA
jgi:competence protein ComFC